MDNEHPPIHKYVIASSTDRESFNSHGQLEPSHTHFFFFDDGSNNVTDMLLKRQEVEHEISISKVLRSPVPGFPAKNTGMLYPILKSYLLIILTVDTFSSV